MRSLFTRSRGPRELAEAEAYLRCHGDRTGEVLAVTAQRLSPRPESVATGEGLRQALEARLDRRRPASAGD